ncbi:MAG: YicC/YloC family endoribonuclease [Planctomycetota bacterium]|jgi:uncharacterized protein (TIGR00255 family)
MTHVYSMTGFGKASGTGAKGEEVQAEVRSFNSKSLKLTVRLPSVFGPQEEGVRALVKKYIRRGSVAVSIRFRSPADLPDVRVNTKLLERYAFELKALGEGLEMDTKVDLSQLAHLPGAVEILEGDRDVTRDEVKLLLTTLEEALKGHAGARLREGEGLAEDIAGRATASQRLVEEIARRAPEVVQDYRDRLTDRLKDLLPPDGGPDGESLRMEIAVFAERSDIHEECVRAKNHLDSFLDLLSKGGELGRRLDFIAQEIHRELSTINAKANDYEISDLAVRAKAEVDKIKEQVQNVE